MYTHLDIQQGVLSPIFHVFFSHPPSSQIISNHERKYSHIKEDMPFVSGLTFTKLAQDSQFQPRKLIPSVTQSLVLMKTPER